MWNQWYKDRGLDRHMIPIDVENSSQFVQKLKELESDIYCLGGAIAVPFKEDAAKYTRSQYESVNCLYRSKNGDFISENTDGIAGKRLLLDNLNEDSTLYIIGYGATCKSIYSHIKNINRLNIKIFERKKKKSEHYLIEELENKLSCDSSVVVFNATTVGGQMNPKGELIDFKILEKHKILKWIDINNSQDPISEIQKNCIELGIEYIDGNKMNEIQAAEAFHLVN